MSYYFIEGRPVDEETIKKWKACGCVGCRKVLKRVTSSREPLL